MTTPMPVKNLDKTSQQKMRTLLRKIRTVLLLAKQVYFDFALMLLLTVCLFVGVNMVVVMGRVVKQQIIRPTVKPIISLPAHVPRSLYANYTDQQLADLLAETWSRPYRFDQKTVFEEAPAVGTYVNVSDVGYRFGSNQGPWPIDSKYYNIFVFGGSTTFGYGVADWETIPSRLQTELVATKIKSGVRVYNFGVGYFTSSLERIKFEELLLNGAVPDLAIFIDGLNDFAGVKNTAPFYQEIAAFIDDDSRNHLLIRYAYAELVNKIPVVHALQKRTVGLPETNPSQVDLMFDVERSAFNEPALLEKAIQRYQLNKTAIESVAAMNKVKTLFVWQPSPVYSYPTKFQAESYGTANFAYYGYPLMAEYVARHEMGNNFLWLADMQEQTEQPLYVDTVHYSASMSAVIAEQLAQHLKKSAILY